MRSYRYPLYSLLPSLALALTPILTEAAVVEVAQTGVITHSPCPSFCGGPGGTFLSDFDGGVGFTTSFSSISNSDGNAQARADLNGPTELPVLRAQGFSQANSRATGEAVGMQGFFYNGAGSGTYNLDVVLTGIANDPNPSPTTTDGNVSAHVLIFRDNDPTTATDFSTDYSTLKFEILSLSGELEELADAGQTLTIVPDNLVHSVPTTLSISGLNTGDLIYVWASLIGSGTRSGFGNGFSTLNLAFQDPSGLSHSAVPIPAAGLLFAPALLMLGALRTRRAARGGA